MSLVQQNLAVRFQELGSAVASALRTQLGDAARLNEHKRQCLQFLSILQPGKSVSKLNVNTYSLQVVSMLPSSQPMTLIS